jgi:hypothetical protein
MSLSEFDALTIDVDSHLEASPLGKVFGQGHFQLAT